MRQNKFCSLAVQPKTWVKVIGAQYPVVALDDPVGGPALHSANPDQGGNSEAKPDHKVLLKRYAYKSLGTASISPFVSRQEQPNYPLPSHQETEDEDLTEAGFRLRQNSPPFRYAIKGIPYRKQMAKFPLDMLIYSYILLVYQIWGSLAPSQWAMRAGRFT
jgi:hypothetical protein